MMTPKKNLSRRTLLRGLGAAVALPWLESMGPLQNWARGVVDNLSGYPGLPKDTFGGTQYIVRTTGARWTKEQEP